VNYIYNKVKELLDYLKSGSSFEFKKSNRDTDRFLKPSQVKNYTTRGW